MKPYATHYRLNFKTQLLIAEQLIGSLVVSSKEYSYHSAGKEAAISAAIKDHASLARDNDIGTA